jgi:DNA-binding NarL/FixJ family response regulator
VVVADVVMPELNGIEAARQIKETDPTVKVLMLSGHEDPELIEAAFEAGAAGYVVKIRAFEELIPAIESVLSGRPYRPLINS